MLLTYGFVSFAGTFTYPDGSRYEGSWVDDQRNGHGVYRYANGDTFEGDWYEHKRHGYGIYTYATTGTSYRGMWEAGQKKGSGDIVNADHKFSGMFSDKIYALEIYVGTSRRFLILKKILVD